MICKELIWYRTTKYTLFSALLIFLRFWNVTPAILTKDRIQGSVINGFSSSGISRSKLTT